MAIARSTPPLLNAVAVTYHRRHRDADYAVSCWGQLRTLYWRPRGKTWTRWGWFCNRCGEIYREAPP